MPKQILLVDDSVTIHRVVEITFAHEDFAVTAVKSADDGLDQAKKLRPDVVLADAGLAGKTGYDLCGALRADGALAKTACLILTGNFTPYDEQRGGKAGADGFVVKPFETQVLIDKVKEAIARRAGGEAPRAPVAAAPAAMPQAAASPRAGIESLGKPLSTVAAETSARIPQQPAPLRPAPLPMPPSAPAPVVAAAPPGPRPQPKATLMGIPAVNPNALGVTPAAPAATVLRPPTPGQPIHIEPARPSPSAPIRIEPPRASPSAPIRIEPPRPAPVAAAPSAPIRVEPPRPSPPPAAAHPSTLPANVPQMPRASLVPGVATPKPVEAAPRVDSVPGISAVVRQAAERAASAVPAAVVSQVATQVSARASAAGPEYEAIAKLSREVIEQVVWEVVPELAETIIRAELDRLVRERQNA